MTITWTDLNPDAHTWFVWESEPYRIQKSTSDLNGTDVCIHHSSPEGILSELRSIFWRKDLPSVPEMMRAHRFVESALQYHILPKAGTSTPYAPGVFKELCLLASRVAELLRRPLSLS